MNIKRYVISVLLMLVIFPADRSYAVSAAVRSTMDYGFMLETLRHLHVMIENFGDEQMKKKHGEIKTLFQQACEHYYGQEFVNSELKFTKLKMELIDFLGVIDDLYLKRTKEILDSTTKDSFETLLEYSKGGALANYLRKPFNPLKDKKMIEPEKYHLFRDREKIAAYIKEGFKKYEKAKSIYNDEDIQYLKKKKNRSIKSINYIISSYTEVVFLCREAKQCGIEIHRLINVNETGKSLIKYDISHRGLIPVYDDRIPEQYKVDANDNLRLIHRVEQKKLNK